VDPNNPASWPAWPDCIDDYNNRARRGSVEFDGAIADFSRNAAKCAPFRANSRTSGISKIVRDSEKMIYMRNPSLFDYSSW
jgi:hypothetical protein